MGYELIIKNASIPQGDRQVLTDILVNKGVIVGFAKDIDAEADTIIDAQGKLVLPGVIDSHTHFNDPGFTHREDFVTGTSSAAAGGVTMIVDMPCCSVPSVRSVENLHNKLNALEGKGIVDYAMWGGITGEDVRNDVLDIVKEQAAEGVVAFKVYMTPSVPSYPRVTDPEMLEAFYAVAETGMPIGIHAENYAICDYYTQKLKKEGRMDYPAWAGSAQDSGGKSGDPAGHQLLGGIGSPPAYRAYEYGGRQSADQGSEA